LSNAKITGSKVDVTIKAGGKSVEELTGNTFTLQYSLLFTTWIVFENKSLFSTQQTDVNIRLIAKF